jgi:sulfatase modifying factor 1
MGTDYRNAFPADGEGPSAPSPTRPSPFAIDTYPVTNRDFAFVSATNYLTESEHFQWSFVFWAHLPPSRIDELVEDTVAAAPSALRKKKWEQRALAPDPFHVPPPSLPRR